MPPTPPHDSVPSMILSSMNRAPQPRRPVRAPGLQGVDRVPARRGPPRVGPSLVPLLLALLLTGCHAPRPRFVVGLFGAPPTDALPELARTGFSVVVGHPSPDYLSAAARNGLQVLASPDAFPPAADPTDSGARRAARATRAIDRHSALWAWYLADEPELHRVPPVELERSRAALRRASAHKPVVLAFYNGYLARDYAHLADAFLINRYPIPRLPLADFAKHVQLARLSAGPDRPLYPVLQAFDWAVLEPAPAAPLSAPSRPPTRAELRAMTWLALVHGAQGVFFYSYRSDPWHLPDHPETWADVQDVVREIRLFEPLFAARRAWLPYTARFPNPDDPRNEALDPSIQAALLHVGDAAGNDFVPPGRYLVAVNTLDRPVAWRFQPPPGWPADLVAFHELRGFRARNGWISDVLPPFGVRVYLPSDAPPPRKTAPGHD